MQSARLLLRTTLRRPPRLPLPRHAYAHASRHGALPGPPPPPPPAAPRRHLCAPRQVAPNEARPVVETVAPSTTPAAKPASGSTTTTGTTSPPPAATPVATPAATLPQVAATTASPKSMTTPAAACKEVANPPEVPMTLSSPAAATAPTAPQLESVTTAQATATLSPSAAGASATPVVPNVPSTSLGLFEEADEKDPKLWKKFLIKYVGAVVLFMVSYKALHWYVDGLKAEGKRKREELEENKMLGKELRASSPELPTLKPPGQQFSSSPSPSPFASPTPSGTATPQMQTSSSAVLPLQTEMQQSQPQTPLEYLEQISAPIPVSSSELDELYAYRSELEAKVVQLTASSSSEAHDAELASVTEEVSALRDEIALLESKKDKPS